MSFFRTYLGYLKPHWWRVGISFLTGLVFVAFSGVSFWMTADFLQALFTGKIMVVPKPEGAMTLANVADFMKHYSTSLVAADSPLDTLKRAIVFIVVAFVIKNISLYIQVIMSAFIEHRIGRKMRDDLYESLMGQDLAFFHVRKSGDLVAAGINDIAVLNAGLAESFAKILRDPLNILVFLFLLMSISWKMTLATIVIAPIAGIATGVAGQSLKRKSKRTQQKVGAVTSRLNEALYGVRIVQAYGGEAHEESRFREATKSHYRQAVSRERLRRLVGPINEMSGVIVIAIILWVAGGHVLQGQWITPDDFVRFLVLLFGLLTPLVSLGEVQARLKTAEGAASRVFDLMAEEQAIKEAEAPKHCDAFSDQIGLKDVTLQYGEAREVALDNVSLSIGAGERVVLVGRSGSGKSSVLNLLPRFYDPSNGEVLLDGTNIRELAVKDLRGLFGIVTQEVTLFNDTVRNNIAYGKENATEDEIIQAAKMAQAHEFIVDLPKGYDTDLGNLGERLSGGQRQRISIARALLKDPPVLLLDEPTSALDSDVAEEIERTLEEVSHGRTVIMATHRLSSIHDNDRVVFFDHGKILAEGIHRHLMDSHDDYRELVKKQLLKAD